MFQAEAVAEVEDESGEIAEAEERGEARVGAGTVRRPGGQKMVWGCNTMDTCPTCTFSTRKTCTQFW